MQALWMVLGAFFFATMSVAVKYASASFNTAELVLYRTDFQDLIESRVAEGRMFRGPSAVWFRMRYPLLEGEAPSAAQRVADAADSSNGISAVLDFRKYLFVNSDLTVNLLRQPQGEWVCVDAHTLLGPAGGGIAESRIFDALGLVGRATQSLAVRARE